MEKSTVSGIYFYVQRSGEVPIAENGVIRFNRERLNIGGAMDMSSGVFTVPKNGIYFLSFSMSKDGYNIESMWIYFRINGFKIGTAVAGTGLLGLHAVMQSTLKLKKGDRVDLWKSRYGALEYRSGDPSSHFTGWLLSEEQ